MCVAIMSPPTFLIVILENILVLYLGNWGSQCLLHFVGKDGKQQCLWGPGNQENRNTLSPGCNFKESYEHCGSGRALHECNPKEDYSSNKSDDGVGCVYKLKVFWFSVGNQSVVKISN
jgi:hypothetical protein